MPLKAVLDSLNGLDEGVKALYRAGTETLANKFVLDIEPVGGWALEDIGGLRNAFTAVKEERDQAKAEIKGFEGLGAASTVRDKLNKLTRLEAINPEIEADRLAAAKVRAKVDGLVAQHTADLGERDARNLRLVKEIERLVISDRLSTSIEKHGGSSPLLDPHIRSRLTVHELEDGAFAVKTLDQNGKPAFSWRGNEMVDATIEDLVLELKDNPAFAGAFKATASGSGAKGSDNTGVSLAGEANPFAKSTFNLTEQGRLKREDPAKYEALKRLAAHESAPSFNLTDQMRARRAGSAA